MLGEILRRRRREVANDEVLEKELREITQTLVQPVKDAFALFESYGAKPDIGLASDGKAVVCGFGGGNMVWFSVDPPQLDGALARLELLVNTAKGQGTPTSDDVFDDTDLADIVARLMGRCKKDLAVLVQAVVQPE